MLQKNSDKGLCKLMKSMPLGAGVGKLFERINCRCACLVPSDPSDVGVNTPSSVMTLWARGSGGVARLLVPLRVETNL